MKKRILSLLLSVVMLTALLGITPAMADDTATAAEAPWYRWDFNNSLEATTTNGGSANTLTRADSNNDFAQVWGDGTIKFSAETAEEALAQYYQLATIVPIDYKKSWKIEWRGSLLENGTNKHSTVWSSSKTSSIYGIINGDGDLRLNNDSWGRLDGSKNMITDTNFHTCVIKNIPSADGTYSTIYYSVDGNNFITNTDYANAPENDNSTALISDIKYLFGPGWAATTNYKGEMDYFEVHTDVQKPIKSISGTDVEVISGEGTITSPYTANISLPYLTESFVVDNAYQIVDLKMYSDNTFSTAIDTPDAKGIKNTVLYMVADGKYYIINVDFSVDLTKDSAEYKFDFNGNLETSNNGLYNKVTSTVITEGAEVTYTNDSFETTGEKTGIYPLFEKGLASNSSINSFSPSIAYPLKNVIKIDYTKPWKISFRGQNSVKMGSLVSSNNGTFIGTQDWYLRWFIKNGGDKQNLYDSYAFDGSIYKVELKNSYDASTDKNAITFRRQKEGSSTVEEKITEWDGVAHTTVGRNMDIYHIFTNNGTLWGYKGYMDYLYIDTDSEKTSAMKFLVDYSDEINEETVNADNLSNILSMVEAYDALSDNSKAYITRGENEKIDALKTHTNSYIVTNVAGGNVEFISGTGIQSNPVEYNVTLPYNVKGLAAADFTTLSENGAVTLYENDSYATAVENVALDNYNNTVYVKVNDTFVKLNAANKVDLTKDSKKYYFDFNGSLTTSNNGLVNALAEKTTVGVNYNEANTALDLNNNGFSINTPITLKATENWELSMEIKWDAVSTSNKKMNLLSSAAQSKEFSININDSTPRIYRNQSGTNTINAVYELENAPVSGWASQQNMSIKIYNKPDASGNVIAAKHKAASNSMWSGEYTYTVTDDSMDYTNTDLTFVNMFTMGTWFNGINSEVNYFYLDMDKDVTSAMEYLAKYESVFNGEADDVTKKQAVIDYYLLTDNAKAELTRGEAVIIEGIKSLATGTVVLTSDGYELSVTSIGADISNAKLVFASYLADNLANIADKDVNVSADKTVTYKFAGDYTDHKVVTSVKAILVDGYADIKPLSNAIKVK